MILCHCFLATLSQSTWASLDASKKGKKTENVSFACITWITSHNMILRWVKWGKCSTETLCEDVLYWLIREKKTLNFSKFGLNVALISKLLYCSRNSLCAMGHFPIGSTYFFPIEFPIVLNSCVNHAYGATIGPQIAPFLAIHVT